MTDSANTVVTATHTTTAATIHDFSFPDGSKQQIVVNNPPVKNCFPDEPKKDYSSDDFVKSDVPDVANSVKTNFMDFFKKHEMTVTILMVFLGLYVLTHWHWI
jgi:hypothetical protein